MNTWTAHDRCTVLLVEDEPEILETLRDLMLTEGHEVLTATSGEEALEIMERTRPCIVLSDVSLPGMDGFALCRRLKQNPESNGIPVLLISGRITEEEVDTWVEAGAVDCLRKPLDNAEVRMRVRTHIGLQEALRRTTALQEQLAVISRAAKDAILIMNDEGIITHWNHAAEAIFGHSRREALGQDLHDLLVPLRFREKFSAAFPKFRASGRGSAVGKTLELEAIRKGGEEFPIELSLSAALVDYRWHAIGIVRDITERRQLTRDLELSAERHRLLFESSRDALMTITPPSWRFSSANPATLRMFGARDEADFVSRVPWELSPEHQLDGRRSDEKAGEMIETALLAGSHVFDWTHRRLDGTEFPATVLLTRMELNGQILMQATVRDVTAQKELEAQLVQAQRLESVGTLASGVAHEINNPLMAILNFAELITIQAGQDATIGAHAAWICKEATRAAKIVKCLLSFAHRDETSLRPARAVDLVEEAVSLVGAILRREQILLHVDVPRDLPPIQCQGPEIQQVIINLLTNARDALRTEGASPQRGKKVTVLGRELRAGTQPHEGDGIKDPPDPTGGHHGACRRYVRLTVEDNGSGIPEKIRERIFDPFFTTKPVGEGTGLGLSISHGIVKRHGGMLTVESEPRGVTRFHVDLPVAVEDCADPAAEHVNSTKRGSHGTHSRG